MKTKIDLGIFKLPLRFVARHMKVGWNGAIPRWGRAEETRSEADSESEWRKLTQEHGLGTNCQLHILTICNKHIFFNDTESNNQ